MSPLAVFVFLQACLLQNAFAWIAEPGCGCGGPLAGPYAGLGPYGAAYGELPLAGPFGAPLAGPFGAPLAGPFGAPLAGPFGGPLAGPFDAPFEGPMGAYGGEGVGNIGVAGEMPVAGTTLVSGQVPILGAVRFAGDLPAGGVVTIAGSSGCGCRGPYY